MYELLQTLNLKINTLTLALNITYFEQKSKSLSELGEMLCNANLDHLENGGMWIWNYQTNEVYYSDGFCKSLGFGYMELGNGFDGFDFGNKDEMSIGLTMIENLISKNSIEPFINMITYKTKHNQNKLIKCVGSVFYKEGKPLYILGTHTIKS